MKMLWFSLGAVFVLISQTLGLDVKSRLVQGKVGRAIVKGATWLKDQQDQETGLWENCLYLSGAAALSLHLTGFEPQYKDALIDTWKNASLNNELQDLPEVRLAFIVLGLQALCENPSDFSGEDYISILKSKMYNFPNPGFDNFFQYGIAMIALCNSKTEIPEEFIKKLIQGQLEDGDYESGIEATSMAAQALQCVCTYQGIKHRRACRAMKAAARNIKQQQNADGSFGDQYCTALSIQALLSYGTKKMNWYNVAVVSLLSWQEDTGSFGSVEATYQVIPALNMALYTDVPITNCTGKQSEVEENFQNFE